MLIHTCDKILGNFFPNDLVCPIHMRRARGQIVAIRSNELNFSGAEKFQSEAAAFHFAKEACVHLHQDPAPAELLPNFSALHGEIAFHVRQHRLGAARPRKLHQLPNRIFRPFGKGHFQKQQGSWTTPERESGKEYIPFSF